MPQPHPRTGLSQSGIALGFPRSKIIGIYVQTGDQDDYAEVTKHEFFALNRCDLLNLFKKWRGEPAREKSEIVDDFEAHLQRIEDDVQSFRTVPLNAWTEGAWRGFFSCLQPRLKGARWDKVPNKTGGFVGLWWDESAISDRAVYLQLEEEKLCFKTKAGDAKRSSLRDYWSRLVVKLAEARGVPVRYPDRFGSGEYMTVAVWNHDYRVANGAGLIDLEATMKNIKAAEAHFEACVQAASTTPFAPVV